MLNIEKYHKEIAKLYENDNLPCSIYRVREKDTKCYCGDCTCTECVRKSLEWLCEEYIEPILTDKECEYLSAVIKPFRNVIEWISKNPYRNDFEYIDIKYIEDNGYQIMTFPLFKEGTMYKGMALKKEYTLEELGL